MTTQVDPLPFLELLHASGIADLGPSPRASALSEAKLEQALAPLLRAANLPSTRQDLVRAVVLLWHDHLDSAHAIAQVVENADGSLVHGMMHRREPDYSNAKYWFRRAGNHPAFVRIADKIAAMKLPEPAKQIRARLVPGGAWDALAFVDLCESAGTGEQQEGITKFLQDIQRLEIIGVLEFLLGS